MKHIIAIVLAASIISPMISCTKNSNSTENSKAAIAILGKWGIQVDSSYQGAGFGNHLVVYTGQAGDYFDFRTDGNVYTKEGAIFNTLSYNLTSGTTIVISSFPGTSHITILTTHNAVISSRIALTPGGAFGRIAHLSR